MIESGITMLFPIVKLRSNLKETKTQHSQEKSISQKLVGMSSSLTYRFFQFFYPPQKTNLPKKTHSTKVHPDTGISSS